MHQGMLHDFATMRPGKVAKTDLLDLMAPHVREVDPEWFDYQPSLDSLPTLAQAPGNSTALMPNGYRLLPNHALMREGLPEVHALIRELPAPYREVYRYLETEYGLLVPVGMEDLAMFMIAEYRAAPHAFGSADVMTYGQVATMAWTKPSTTGLRWAQILLIGAGGSAGGGARVTTASNDAAGGGGGGGGGCILRLVTLASLSNGNVVIGQGLSAGGSQSTANTNGNGGNAGQDTTFAGLTAGGGGAGGGGTQGSGAQTGASGSGGSGDIAGTAGGTGRSGATVGDNGGDQTTGPAAAGGGGGGGATADTAQADAGRGGRGWHGTGLKGTVGGGAAGTTASRPGGAAQLGTGAGGGGGAGSNASNTAGGNGGSQPTNAVMGGGGGGGGGRARNAATTTGNGAQGGTPGDGYAAVISF